MNGTTEDLTLKPDSRPSLIHSIVALLLYTAVIMAFHAGVLSSLNKAVLGEVWDHQLYLWDAWWIKESVLRGQSPFFSDMIFAPEGTPLVLHTLVPLPAAAISILGLFLSTELAYNLVVLAAFPIAGMAAYFLCRRLTRDHLSSMAGGLVFMLSPFMVSKSVAGWVNLLYAGLLPLFFLSLLKATDPEGSRRASLQLALMTLLVLFTSEMLTVFAVNITVFTVVWRLWSSSDRRGTALRLIRTGLPSVIVAAPLLIMMVYYVAAYDLPANVNRRLSYCPDFISYFFPLNMTSIYSGWLLGEPVKTFPPVTSTAIFPDITKPDLACYLGLLVAPLSLLGLFLKRHNREVRFFIFTFFAFFLLSFGPVLLINRDIVRVFGIPVVLPFAVWQFLPGLGAVAQSGRYLVISYAALAVGFACLAAVIRQRFNSPAAHVCLVGLGLAVCADYGFRTWVSELPQVPPLSAMDGSVLDPRLKSGYPMYYQTQHERPLVGGYISRTPPRPMQRYLAIPGMECLFFGNRNADCSREAIFKGLDELKVRDVMLGPRDWRNDLLSQFGFERRYSDQLTTVWSVPISSDPQVTPDQRSRINNP